MAVAPGRAGQDGSASTNQPGSPMLVAFRGYGIDFIVTGRVELRADRLTDLVNESETIELREVVLEGLHDLARVVVPDYSIRRDELLAVKVAGPRGARLWRVPTTRHRLQAQIGPYNVLGRLHTPSGDSVAHRLSSSGPMLPLTDATIAYVIGGILEVRDAATILINRELASWVRAEDVAPGVRPIAGPTVSASPAAPDGLILADGRLRS